MQAYESATAQRSETPTLLVYEPDPTHHHLPPDLRERYLVVYAPTPESVAASLAAYPHSLLVLCGGESIPEALLIARSARERHDLPIMLVGGTDDQSDVRAAYEAGVDDYLRDSAHGIEVTFHVEGLLVRRRDFVRQTIGLPCGLVIDIPAHTLSVHGTRVTVTPKEFEVARVLLQNRGRVVSTDALANEAWGYPTFGERNFVEAHVSRLRTKLRNAGLTGVIETIRGVGYVIR